MGVMLATCAFIGVYFRPFWRSDLGMPTFIVILWVALSLSLGWGGRGKPYSLRFGLVAGSALVLAMVICFLLARYAGIHIYVAMVPLVVFLWFSAKSRFVQARLDEIAPDAGDGQR